MLFESQNVKNASTYALNMSPSMDLPPLVCMTQFHIGYAARLAYFYRNTDFFVLVPFAQVYSVVINYMKRDPWFFRHFLFSNTHMPNYRTRRQARCISRYGLPARSFIPTPLLKHWYLQHNTPTPLNQANKQLQSKRGHASVTDLHSYFTETYSPLFKNSYLQMSHPYIRVTGRAVGVFSNDPRRPVIKWRSYQKNLFNFRRASFLNALLTLTKRVHLTPMQKTFYPLSKRYAVNRIDYKLKKRPKSHLIPRQTPYLNRKGRVFTRLHGSIFRIFYKRMLNTKRRMRRVSLKAFQHRLKPNMMRYQWRAWTFRKRRFFYLLPQRFNKARRATSKAIKTSRVTVLKRRVFESYFTTDKLVRGKIRRKGRIIFLKGQTNEARLSSGNKVFGFQQFVKSFLSRGRGVFFKRYRKLHKQRSGRLSRESLIRIRRRYRPNPAMRKLRRSTSLSQYKRKSLPLYPRLNTDRRLTLAKVKSPQYVNPTRSLFVRHRVRAWVRFLKCLPCRFRRPFDKGPVRIRLKFSLQKRRRVGKSRFKKIGKQSRFKARMKEWKLSQPRTRLMIKRPFLSLLLHHPQKGSYKWPFFYMLCLRKRLLKKGSTLLRPLGSLNLPGTIHHRVEPVSRYARRQQFRLWREYMRNPNRKIRSLRRYIRRRIKRRIKRINKAQTRWNDQLSNQSFKGYIVTRRFGQVPNRLTRSRYRLYTRGKPFKFRKKIIKGRRLKDKFKLRKISKPRYRRRILRRSRRFRKLMLQKLKSIRRWRLLRRNPNRKLRRSLKRRLLLESLTKIKSVFDCGLLRTPLMVHKFSVRKEGVSIKPFSPKHYPTTRNEYFEIAKSPKFIPLFRGFYSRFRGLLPKFFGRPIYCPSIPRNLNFYSRYNAPFIFSLCGFLFVQTNKLYTNHRRKNSWVQARIQKYQFSFFYKDDIKRFYLRKAGRLKLLASVINPSKFIQHDTLMQNMFRSQPHPITGVNAMPSDGTLAATSLQSRFQKPFSLQPGLEMTTYMTNLKPFKALEPRIKRIRFKPGYSRIWRRAREAINHSLGFHFRYQKALTTRLSKVRRWKGSWEIRIREWSLLRLVLNSHFVYDLHTSLNMIQSYLVYVNGHRTHNPRMQLHLGDFIQIPVNFRYYTLHRWLVNFHAHDQLRLTKLTQYKNNKSKYDLSKQKSYHLPDWIFWAGSRNFDIPKYLEVDYFTLSSFIIYEPWTDCDFNPLVYLEDRSRILRMYNWKYIN